MYSFETTIMWQHDYSPLEHLAAAFDDDELLDEVEVEIEVDYHPGYDIPAKLSGHPDSWAPAEGEDPELEAVVVVATGQDILSLLSPEQGRRLVQECWEHQSDDSGYY